LIENNNHFQSQNRNFAEQIKTLEKENRELKDQISNLQNQVQDLHQQNEALNNEVITLKNDLNKFPIIPLKRIEEFSLQTRKLTKSKIRDSSFQLQQLNDQMIHFNKQMQKQFQKSFPFEFLIEESKIEQKFPFQANNHEGLFFNFNNIYSIHLLKNLIRIQTSSDWDQMTWPKENVLTWRSSQWASKIESNAWISFSFLSSDFTIEGY
jgi:regulator of replication initiation timing